MSSTRDLAPVIVFDGECGFCTKWTIWLLSRARRPLRALPAQAIEPEALGIRRGDLLRTVWWVEPGGRVDGGHRAIGRALTRLGGAWRALGRALLLPPMSWVARLGYAVVTRLRKHLPGVTPACRTGWDLAHGRPLTRSPSLPPEPRPGRVGEPGWDCVDEASWESFPASDAPGWSCGR